MFALRGHMSFFLSSLIKFLICLSAIEADYSILALIIVFASLITAAYYFRVIQVFYSNPDYIDKELVEENNNENILFSNRICELVPICILTGFALLIGIFPAIGLSVIKPSVEVLLSIMVVK